MLSLSRFTALVRWEFVEDDFRPLRNHPSIQITLGVPTRMNRVCSLAPCGRRGVGLTRARWRKERRLKGSDTMTTASEGRWLWTGASDGTITVGWIVRNFNYAGLPLWQDQPNLTATRPYMHISGLDGGTHELVWYDDHKGQLLAGRQSFTGSSYVAEVPATDAGQFGKSIAFLIQPVGYTPEKSYAALPNTLIGQIDVSPTESWHAEVMTVRVNTPLMFTARTKYA